MNKKYFDANKELWDEFAKLHFGILIKNQISFVISKEK